MATLCLSIFVIFPGHGGRLIVQERLKNHPALAPITNGALSTLRIVTCTDPSGSIDLMPPVIRIPVGRAVVDNFALGGLSAPIDLASGTVCGPAVQMHNGLGLISTDKHPDTGQKFRGFCIPMWTEAVHLARQAHETFHRCISSPGMSLYCAMVRFFSKAIPFFIPV